MENIMDSPCHHCPRCPCKEHDTCEDYIKYRAELDKVRDQKLKTQVVRDYVNKSIDKSKRRNRKK